MNASWLTVKDKLPESGEEVLIYYYDEPYEIDVFLVLTYYRKGYKLTCEDITNGDLLGQILGKYDREVEEDGFYIYDNGRFRKHVDVITHWQPLLKPCLPS